MKQQEQAPSPESFQSLIINSGDPFMDKADTLNMKVRLMTAKKFLTERLKQVVT